MKFILFFFFAFLLAQETNSQENSVLYVDKAYGFSVSPPHFLPKLNEKENFGIVSFYGINEKKIVAEVSIHVRETRMTFQQAIPFMRTVLSHIGFTPTSSKKDTFYGYEAIRFEAKNPKAIASGVVVLQPKRVFLIFAMALKSYEGSHLKLATDSIGSFSFGSIPSAEEIQSSKKSIYLNRTFDFWLNSPDFPIYPKENGINIPVIFHGFVSIKNTLNFAVQVKYPATPTFEYGAKLIETGFREANYSFELQEEKQVDSVFQKTTYRKYLGEDSKSQIKFQTFCLFTEKPIFALSSSASSILFESHQPYFEEVIKSFKLLPKEE